jgi:hypothetical protein
MEMRNLRKTLLSILGILAGLCLLLVAAISLGNLQLPQRSPVMETLSEGDTIRMAEYLNLHDQLGEAVWPGWGEANIPAILYNEEYAFLLGYADPPDGWVKVPSAIQRGSAWELVPDDLFRGQSYYRQRLADPELTPEAFTVKVGDRWVSSMPTLDWFRISLTNQIREDLPPFVRPIFPYSLFIGQLVSGSDQYISLSAHEAFHSYQGMMAPQKFAEAELINQHADRYPWDDESLQMDWQNELDLLADALRSSDRAQTAELVRQFLALRAARRESADLSPELIAYEQNREWLEGLARYAELEIWRQAATAPYAPISEAGTLSDFADYGSFDRRWTVELDQITRMATDEGDGRFYYTGMAQAILLDRLLPGWKFQAFDDEVWLEDLLADMSSAQ